MGAAFSFDHRIEFLPGSSTEILRQIPAAPGVFSLRGADEASEPYLTRAADIRRRLRRLLAPPEALDEQGRPILSKRLNLREKVRWIEYNRTGSDFESGLVLYCATRAAFGPEDARRRLRLHPPYFLRVTMRHEHPRVYATNRLSKKSLAESFGPFPSRAAAERYCDAVLDLFKIRRCHEDLEPFPDHPGCAYGEMKMCMAPCKQACTTEAYAAEAQKVFAFFTTRGESMLGQIAAQRDAASEAMDFETAATLHAQWEKVRAAAQLADDLVRPVPELRAVIVQEAAPRPDAAPDLSSRPESTPSPDPHQNLSSPPESAPAGVPMGQSLPEWGGLADEVERPAGLGPPIPMDPQHDAALFLLDGGRILGPERLSTLGVRAVREQTAVGSSLFAQPLMLAAVPLEEPAAGAPATLSPEDRARAVLAHLTARASSLPEPDIAERCDYLSLFRRWYYRPEKQRMGEVFLPVGSTKDGEGAWPIRRLLNGAARVILGPPGQLPPVDREAAKILKTKVIHAGREGVERIVPVLPKRSRSRKAITPIDVLEKP